jgi:transposase
MVICLEAGSQSAWAERILRDLGHDIVVANPTRVRLIAEATLKNDHVDAVTLVRLVRADRKLLCPIVHRSAETQRQRGILRSRRALVNARTSCLNAARDRLLQAAPASGCSGKDRVTSSATRGTAHPQPTQVAKTGPRLPAHPDA